MPMGIFTSRMSSPVASPNSSGSPIDINRKLFSPSGEGPSGRSEYCSSMQQLKERAAGSLTEDGSMPVNQEGDLLQCLSPVAMADGSLAWPPPGMDPIYLSPLKYVGSTDPVAVDLHQLASIAGCKVSEEAVEEMGRQLAKKHRNWVRWMLPGNAPCILLKEMPLATLADTLSA